MTKFIVSWNVQFCLLLLAVYICFINISEASSDHFQHTLGHVKPQASAKVQAEAARKVAQRLLGTIGASLFSISVDPDFGISGRDRFKISKSVEDNVEILATSGVAAAWGLHYYLKHYCNVHIAWEGMQLELPNKLPEVELTVTSNDRFRYYQNVVVAGYSTVWWKWEQWEKHIDWMALNGINLALAFHGQEAIWQKIYLGLNMTQEEIDEHFGGVAFLPWARMGNIRGWGGPLSSSWHKHTVILQHQILGRMRELGIIPVLPAFAGHVPRALTRLFPAANVTETQCWNHFNDQYCCPNLLNPVDPLFKKLGSDFLKEYINEFGTDHVYSCDTFNENEPPTTNLASLRNISRSIYDAMTTVDPGAIWLLQGWLFVHDIIFWTESRVEAFITSVPIGKMIILDLQSEQFPQYTRLKSYYGQPFIWCMLHNFGGTLGMFGSAAIINKRVFEGRQLQNGTMIGTGITPEGINQNYVMYELMNEMAYRRNSVNLDTWFEDYSRRRYGSWNEYTVKAWKTLGRTIYNFSGLQRVRGQYVITRHPSLKIIPWSWYDRDQILSTWQVFLEGRYGRRNSTLYRHDVVDLTRQVLQLTADIIYTNVLNSFNKKNITALRKQASLMLELFDDLEKILASSKDFLLGVWLRDAKSVATNKAEEELYEYNARNQITLWGPNGEIRDYANKQWSGVVADYFKPRWAVFLKALEDSLSSGKKFNATEVNKRIFDTVEQPFTFSRKIYLDEPQGDSIDIALNLRDKWKKKDNFLHGQSANCNHNH
ncbi:alpha-N-acetylglucosaminidase [Cephus cinctus]|uniref:Alpha-N-acetylglucosaminidase n=1 Tax=Cephus cinctus TaxID=211228 RepID=A0AAJ7FI66_CEPCN|nr:alpha-N-acetylglucosaminidase [Cephus cinctus]XP_015593026.1 alpha-N-acetylglucosaminidase [Cephus cinctus]